MGDERRKAKKSSGGDFYRTQEVRVGHRLGGAVVQVTRADNLLLHRTFDQFARELGFGPP